MPKTVPQIPGLEPGRLPFWTGDSLGRPAELGEAIVAWDGAVAAVDINPVAVFETGAVALDALVEAAK